MTDGRSERAEQSPAAAKDGRPSVDPGNTLQPMDILRVAEGHAHVVIGEETQARVVAAHARLMRCIEEGRLVYGLTTGFGPLANRLVGAADGQTLQQNLINHLASGVGRDLPWREARAVVLVRLASICRGWSGASPELASHLAAVLNGPFAPAIPEKGTVGASGDLTPLAHAALAVMGSGDMIDRDGQRRPARAALGAMGLAPYRLAARDGLALVNGTSAMTAIACLNSVRASTLLRWSERITVGLAELLNGRSEAWDPAFGVARPHPGQIASAAALQADAERCARLRKIPAAARRLRETDAGRTEPEAAQDAYTLRCAPQILGAVRDAIDWHDTVLSRELNAATDNPIFPPDRPDAPALHGGNFMGQHIAMVSDALSVAVTTLANHMERLIARVTDERLNGGLPAFLHRGPAGLNSGLMGAQVTATALVAEMRARAMPASIQSLSTNGANQDVVSMGTIAARNASAQIDDAAHVSAIAVIAVAQGADILEARGDRCAAPLSEIRAVARETAPPLAQDRPLGPEIAALASRMGRTRLETSC